MAQRSSTGFRQRAIEQGDALFRRRDVDKSTFGYAKWFAAWSYFHVLHALLLSLIFSDLYLQNYGWVITPLVMISAIVQVLAGNVLFKLPTRIPWTVFGLLLFFAYTFISSALMNADFGRNVALSFGWQTTCLVYYATVSLSVAQAVYVSEKYRDLVKWTVIIVLAISGLWGIMQNFNIGPARTIWIGLDKQPDGIYRPTGFTNYPSQLGFQGMLGMAILGAPLYFKNLKWWDWMGICYFAFVTLSAQYRSMYYAGIGLCLIAFFFLIWRRDKPQSVIFGIVAACIIALPIIIAPGRFAYGLRGAKDDPALKARQLAWSEAEPALVIRPLTGIGPDPSLLLTTGLGKGDRYSTTVLDNLYLSVRVCYGWVGVGLATCFVLVSFGGLIMRLLLGSDQVASWAVVSLIASISIMVFSLTGNSLIHTTVGCCSTLIFSLTAPTWREDVAQSLMTDQFVRLRRSLSVGLRKLGINVG